MTFKVGDTVGTYLGPAKIIRDESGATSMYEGWFTVEYEKGGQGSMHENDMCPFPEPNEVLKAIL